MFRPLLLALLCVSAASAQPLPDLVTDRPDFTESAVVVPLGHVQAEAGATVEFDTNTEIISGPELLVRWTLGGTVVLGLALSDRAGTFVEVATSAPENGASETVLHHGYTILAARAVQFDVYGGLGLTDAAPDYLVGAGLSVRR